MNQVLETEFERLSVTEAHFKRYLPPAGLEPGTNQKWLTASNSFIKKTLAQT